MKDNDKEQVGTDQSAGAETTRGDEGHEPELVKLNLGDRVVELPSEQADIIKRAFDSLAGRYGSELDKLRAQALQGIGRPEAPARETPEKTAPPDFKIPDPDLIFSNKQVWEQGFVQAMDARLSHLKAENEALVQAAVEMVQEELNQRESAQAAKALQEDLTAKMFAEHPALKESPTFVWAVLDEIKEDIKHLPANVAYDRLGEVAEARWNAIRGGTVETPARPRGAAPAPAFLSSARRGGASPKGAQPERKTLTDRILERQQRILRGGGAAA